MLVFVRIICFAAPTGNYDSGNHWLQQRPFLRPEVTVSKLPVRFWFAALAASLTSSVVNGNIWLSVGKPHVGGRWRPQGSTSVIFISMRCVKLETWRCKTLLQNEWIKCQQPFFLSLRSLLWDYNTSHLFCCHFQSWTCLASSCTRCSPSWLRCPCWSSWRSASTSTRRCRSIRRAWSSGWTAQRR